MIVREALESLSQRIASAREPDDLRSALAEVERLESISAAGEELDELRLRALYSLAQLSADNTNLAQEAIVQELLPLCLRTKSEWGERTSAHRYSKLLAEWLNSFPIATRFALRNVVLAALIENLAGPRSERVCRLIGMIGYRGDQEANSLFEIVRSSTDEAADVAMRSLAELGVQGESRSVLLQKWHYRVASVVWNHDLIGTAQTLADVDCLDTVFEYWLNPTNLQQRSVKLLAHFAIAVPGAIAEAHADDDALQDRAWERLRALAPINPTLFFQRVLGSTQVAHPCDAPGVVQYFVSVIGNDEKTRNLAYPRLEECDRPRQLLGWDFSPPKGALQAILHDAIASTAMRGAFMTQDLRLKIHAWQTLFCLGRRSALDDLHTAINAERNGYALGAVLELAACFSIKQLPARVVDLLAGKFEGITNEEAERFSSHIAAIALAHASGSRSAFDALLDFNLVRGGGVLISLLNALTDNAIALIRAGHTSVIEELWQATGVAQPQHRRAAAAAVLGKLLRRRILEPLPAERMSALLQDQTLDRYARREILDALGYAGTLPSDLLQTVMTFLESTQLPNSTSTDQAQNVDFRPAALGSLARQGLLSDYPELLRQHLGFQQIGSMWRLERQSPLPGAAVAIGLLYQSDPEAFGPVVADLLRIGDWAAVVQLTPFLQKGLSQVSELVVGEIIARIHRAGPAFAEPDLFSLLAKVAPQRLASESWSDMIGWPPQMRAALASALALTPQSASPVERNALLTELMGDGQYGVRRAAYRAMGRIASNELRSLCAAWAFLTEKNVQPEERPSVVDLRRRAAEAAAWLESLPTEGSIPDLAYDPEPDVRTTFTRCQQERQKRDWAKQYLGHVVAVGDEESLLRVWRYGMALERIGDDDVLERLERRRSDDDVAPGIRYWLGRLIKELRKQWDEVTRSWPEPWFARRGRLEEFTGTASQEGSVAQSVRCWLWQVPADDIVSFSSWGGWCENVALPGGRCGLQADGKQSATILVTKSNWPDGPSYFVGSGPYPE